MHQRRQCPAVEVPVSGEGSGKKARKRSAGRHVCVHAVGRQGRRFRVCLYFVGVAFCGCVVVVVVCVFFFPCCSVVSSLFHLVVLSFIVLWLAVVSS